MLSCDPTHPSDPKAIELEFERTCHGAEDTKDTNSNTESNQHESNAEAKPTSKQHLINRP